MVNDDIGQPANVPADVAHDLGESFAKEAHWEARPGSCFSADDRSVATIALAGSQRQFLL